MASTTAKGKYPEQLIAMVSTETKGFIRDKAAETDRSISEVARDYLEAGITAIEYALEVTVESVEPPSKTDPTFF